MDHEVKEQEENIVVSFAQLKKVIIKVFVSFFYYLYINFKNVFAPADLCPRVWVGR